MESITEEEIMAIKFIKMKHRWVMNNSENLKYHKFKIIPKITMLLNSFRTPCSICQGCDVESWQDTGRWVPAIRYTSLDV